MERERALRRERTELSRSIHDTTAQSASMIGLGIDAAKQLAGDSNEELTARLEATSILSKTAIWQLRHPIDMGRIFDGKELGRTLESHVWIFTQVTSVLAELVRTGVEPPLSVEARSLLFSIAHNGLVVARAPADRQKQLHRIGAHLAVAGILGSQRRARGRSLPAPARRRPRSALPPRSPAASRPSSGRSSRRPTLPACGRSGCAPAGRPLSPARSVGRLPDGEIAVQVQRERPGRTGGVVPREFVQRGPGDAVMNRHVETCVPVIARNRCRHHPQGRGPGARLRPVFEVRRHVFGRGRQGTPPRRLRPCDEAVPLVDVAIPRPP